MPFVDDVNRILRDHLGYSGDGHGGNGPLPVGDRSTARKPIINRDLRELLILMAQTMGDPSALQVLIDQIAAKADAVAVNLNGVKFYDNRTQAIERDANLLPSGIVRIMTVEAWGVAVRARNSTEDALYDIPPRWGISHRLSTQAFVDAAFAVAIQRANHTGTQPISTVSGLPSALDGLSQAISDGDTGLANALNQNGVKFYDSSAQAVANGANALPSGIVRIMTIESWGVAVRSRNNPTDGLYGTVPYWGISRRLTTEEEVAEAISDAVDDEAGARATGDAASRQRVNHEGTQPINTVAGLPDALAGLSQSSIDRDATEAQAREAGDAAEAQARQQALAAEAEARSAAITSAVAGEAQERETGDANLQGQIDTKAPLIAFERLRLADLDRPGEDPSRWSTVTTGAPEARPALTIGTVVNADYGAVLRISGGDIPVDLGYIDIAPRRAFALEPTRIYMLRAAFARAVNPADPSGDSIEVRLRNLSATKAHVSNVRLGEPHSLTVADGVRTVSVLISRAGGADVDYTPPATARYATPFLRIYGVGQATDPIFVQWADVTNAVLGGADVAAIAGQLEEERQARIAGLTAVSTRIDGEEAARVALRDASSIRLANVGGTASVITADIPAGIGISNPPVGMWFGLTAVGVNAGPVMLSINGEAPLPLYDSRGRDLVGGELSNAFPIEVRRGGSDGGNQYRILSATVNPADVEEAISSERAARDEAISSASAAAIAEANYRANIDSFVGTGAADIFPPTLVSEDNLVLRAVYNGVETTTEGIEANYRANLNQFVGTGAEDIIPPTLVSENNRVLRAIYNGVETSPQAMEANYRTNLDQFVGTGPEGVSIPKYVSEDNLVIESVGGSNAPTPPDGINIIEVVAGNVIEVVAGYGQSNERGQAGTSRDLIYGPETNPGIFTLHLGDTADVWLGLSGPSARLQQSNITGLGLLIPRILDSDTNGTVAVEGFAHQWQEIMASRSGIVGNIAVYTVAQSGQPIVDLLPGTTTPNRHGYSNLVTALQGAFDNRPSGAKVISRFISMCQGEADPEEPMLGPLQDSIRAQYQIDARGITGQSSAVRMISWQPSSFRAYSDGVRSILQHALDTADTGLFLCGGPTYPFGFSDDYLHNPSFGHAMRGELGGAIGHQALTTGEFLPLHMTNAVVTGPNEITVTLSEAAVVETNAIVTATPNLGIGVVGGTITDVVLSGASIELTTAGAASGVTAVTSALTGQLNTRTAERIPRTNIRSAASIGAHSTGAPIRKWLCHQQLNIT